MTTLINPFTGEELEVNHNRPGDHPGGGRGKGRGVVGEGGTATKSDVTKKLTDQANRLSSEAEAASKAAKSGPKHTKAAHAHARAARGHIALASQRGKEGDRKGHARHMKKAKKHEDMASEHSVKGVHDPLLVQAATSGQALMFKAEVFKGIATNEWYELIADNHAKHDQKSHGRGRSSLAGSSHLPGGKANVFGEGGPSIAIKPGAKTVAEKARLANEKSARANKTGKAVHHRVAAHAHDRAEDAYDTAAISTQGKVKANNIKMSRKHGKLAKFHRQKAEQADS